MLHRFDRPGFRQIMLMPGPSNDLENCDLSISTLGHLRSVSGFTWSQTSGRISLHFVTAGSGQLIHDNRRIPLKTGDAFCFFPNGTYRYEDNPPDLWQYTWMAIHGRQAQSCCEQLGFHFNNPVIHDFPIAPIQHIVTEIDNAYRREQHSSFFPQSSAWRIMDQLSGKTEQTAMDQLAQVLRRILDEEYRQMDTSINQIAADLNVNRSTLFRNFQRVYHMAPKAYLEQQRMRHAKALLRTHQMSIKQVAEHCGYEDPQYFSRVFRKHTGIAPSQY